MALETLRSQISHREINVGKCAEEEEEEENSAEFLQQLSLCPACKQESDVILILPCSHTMCGHCLASRERKCSDQSHRRGVNKSVCCVLCPRCQHPVELPFWTWSSATSCLPTYPTLSPACRSGERTSENHLQHVCPEAARPPVTPVDGVVDLQEEEMEQSVYGLHFALEPSSVPPTLHLSNSSLTVTYKGENPPVQPAHNKVMRSAMASDPEFLQPFPQVRSDVVIARGQYYWEVDVCNSSMYRIGVVSWDFSVGWWLERQSLSFCAVYNGSLEPLYTIPPQIKTIGVFLNIGGGTLSFHNPLTQEHLATLPTCFSPAGVVPALGLGHGRLKLRCGLSPPPHLFLCKDSTYRRPCGTGEAWWCREIPFRSVRKVIQKFEELAVSDSDSGLVSSFGSSCSTLASLADLAIPGMFLSSQSGQETVDE